MPLRAAMPFELLDYCDVLGEVIGGEEGLAEEHALVPPVGPLEGGLRGHRAGQQAMGEWAVRHNPDAQLGSR